MAKPVRRSLRETQKELTREVLVDAAREAFEDKGYVEVTVDDIVQRAGASRATFYVYFDGKASILRAVLRKFQLRDEYQALVNRVRSIAEPTVDALQAWFEEYVDFYVVNRALHQAAHQAAVIEPQFAESQLAILDAFVELWREMGYVKNAANEDLRLAALMLFAMGDQFMYLWLVNGVEVDRHKATRALARALHATLGAES
jgi:AcrR family transcriptional regulator